MSKIGNFMVWLEDHENYEDYESGKDQPTSELINRYIKEQGGSDASRKYNSNKPNTGK